jgi:hypothetical protein
VVLKNFGNPLGSGTYLRISETLWAVVLKNFGNPLGVSQSVIEGAEPFCVTRFFEVIWKNIDLKQGQASVLESKWIGRWTEYL